MKSITTTELRSKIKTEKLVKRLEKGKETDLLYYGKAIATFKPKVTG